MNNAETPNPILRLTTETVIDMESELLLTTSARKNFDFPEHQSVSLMDLFDKLQVEIHRTSGVCYAMAERIAALEGVQKPGNNTTPEAEYTTTEISQLKGMNTNVNRCNQMRSMLKRFANITVACDTTYLEMWCMLEQLVATTDVERANFTCGEYSLDSLIDHAKVIASARYPDRKTMEAHCEAGDMLVECVVDEDLLPSHYQCHFDAFELTHMREALITALDMCSLFSIKDRFEYFEDMATNEELENFYHGLNNNHVRSKVALAALVEKYMWRGNVWMQKNYPESVVFKREDVPPLWSDGDYETLDHKVVHNLFKQIGEFITKVASHWQMTAILEGPSDVFARRVRGLCNINYGMPDYTPKIPQCFFKTPGTNFSKWIATNNYCAFNVHKSFEEIHKLIAMDGPIYQKPVDMSHMDEWQLHGQERSVNDKDPELMIDHNCGFEAGDGIVQQDDSIVGTAEDVVNIVSSDVTMAQAADTQVQGQTGTVQPVATAQKQEAVTDEWALDNILTRWFPIDQLDWPATSVANTVIKLYNFHEDFLPAISTCVGNITKQVLANYIFLKYESMEFMIEVNGSPHHTGMFEFVYYPGMEYTSRIQTIYRDSMLPHFWGQIASDACDQLCVAWNTPQPIINMQKRGGWNQNKMGYLAVKVISQLIPPDSGNTVVTLTLLARFRKPEVHIARDATIALEGISMDDIQNGVDTVRGVVELAGMVLDKPTQHHVDISITRSTTVANLTSATGPDGSVRMDINSRSSHYHKPDEVGGTPKELEVLEIAKRPALFKIVKISTTDVKGALVWHTPISPLVSALISTGSGALEIQPSALCMAAKMFAFWRGPINYKFTVVACKMHTFKFMVAQIPSMHQAAFAAAPLSYSTLKNYANKEFDVRGPGSFEFQATYEHDTKWTFVNGLHATSSTGRDWEVVGSQVFAPCSTGMLVIMLVNPLESPANVSTTVEIFMSISAGDGFEFNGPQVIDPRFVERHFLSGEDPNFYSLPDDDSFIKIKVNEMTTSMRKLMKTRTAHVEAGESSGPKTARPTRVLTSITKGERMTAANKTHPINDRGMNVLDLGKRFNVIQRGHVNSADGTFHNIQLPVGPAIDQMDYVSMQYYLASMYVFWSGSMRYKFIMNIANVYAAQIEMYNLFRVPNPDTTSTDTVVPALLAYTHTFSGTESIDFAHYNGLAQHIEVAPETHACEFEIPYRSIFPVCYNLRPNNAHNGYGDFFVNAIHRCSPSLVAFNIENNESLGNFSWAYDMMFAFGDDMMMYQWVPIDTVTLSNVETNIYFGENNL